MQPATIVHYFHGKKSSIVLRRCVGSLFLVGVGCVRRGTVNELHDGECSPAHFLMPKLMLVKKLLLCKCLKALTI